MIGNSTVQKEGSKKSLMVSTTGELTELIVDVVVEYRDKSVFAEFVDANDRFNRDYTKKAILPGWHSSFTGKYRPNPNIAVA